MPRWFLCEFTSINISSRRRVAARIGTPFCFNFTYVFDRILEVNFRHHFKSFSGITWKHDFFKKGYQKLIDLGDRSDNPITIVWWSFWARWGALVWLGARWYGWGLVWLDMAGYGCGCRAPRRPPPHTPPQGSMLRSNERDLPHADDPVGRRILSAIVSLPWYH